MVNSGIVKNYSTLIYKCKIKGMKGHIQNNNHNKMSVVERLLIRGIVLLLYFNLSLCSEESSSIKKKANVYGSPAEMSVSFLQEEWSKGDTDAGGELSFARALGAGVEQDLHDAILHSNSLISVGAARAHTTLALLLNHNLTEWELSKEERENKAMINYVIAAVKGDPLAQIIAGENYFRLGDCVSSVNYYHKAASFAIQNVPEMEISTPNIVRYIWEEDGEIPSDAFPTQDQLDFLEYVASHGETEAALKVATLLITGPYNIQRNVEKAHEYLKEAVKGNSTLAMVFLGQMYLRNIMQGDDVKALKLLEKALKYGNDLAHSGLGRMYMEGKAELEKNFQKAEYHLKKGIEAGNVDAFYQLGKLYSSKEGPGTPHQAVELWKIPASFGHVHSAWCLAEFYRNTFIRSSTRAGLWPANADESMTLCESAVSFYRIVAQAGEWQALFTKAFTDYSSGKKGAALMKYLLLSDLGYRAGHVNAARILDEGSAGIYDDETSSSERGFEMWLRAAKDGVAKAHVRVGDYLYYGIGGNKRNYGAAAENYKKATLMGEAEGGFSLALITEWGEGVDQDLRAAEEIYVQLAKQIPEAEVPVTLALARLKLFIFIRNAFDVDLYIWNWNLLSINNFSSVIQNSLTKWWDIWLITLLLVFILVNLRLRHI